MFSNDEMYVPFINILNTHADFRHILRQPNYSIFKMIEFYPTLMAIIPPIL